MENDVAYFNFGIPRGVQGIQGEQGDKGDTGEAGPAGYTPQKGLDYFTEADIASLNIPSKTSQLTNDSGYITRTSYASEDTGGTIKTAEIFGTTTRNGYLTAEELDYDAYEFTTYEALIGKGTLENVLTAKGFIDRYVNNLTNYTKTSNLSAVATSGSYNDLSNKPDLSGYEVSSNKVTSISSSSTDTQYPSAKCVYDLIGDINSALDSINGEVI